MPVTDCFDYSGLIILFDIRYCDPSHFVLLSQSCFSCSGLFMVPYEFLKRLFYICKICHWYFDRIALNLQIALDRMGILMILILPIYENDICCHLFMSSLISFFPFLYFLSTGLLLPRLGLFLGILFFLLLNQMEFFLNFCF